MQNAVIIRTPPTATASTARRVEHAGIPRPSRAGPTRRWCGRTCRVWRTAAEPNLIDWHMAAVVIPYRRTDEPRRRLFTINRDIARHTQPRLRAGVRWPRAWRACVRHRLRNGGDWVGREDETHRNVRARGASWAPARPVDDLYLHRSMMSGINGACSRRRQCVIVSVQRTRKTRRATRSRASVGSQSADDGSVAAQRRSWLTARVSAVVGLVGRAP